MPRKVRIDAPGALHHIIAGGIGRKKLFYDHYDRDFFIERLGLIILQSQAQCFAWALIPNHFHIYIHLSPLRAKSVADMKGLDRHAYCGRSVMMGKAAETIGIDPDPVWLKGKQPKTVPARSLLCYRAANELGVSQSDLNSRMALSPSAVSLAKARGRQLVKKHKSTLKADNRRTSTKP